jgi:hypothetical protein
MFSFFKKSPTAKPDEEFERAVSEFVGAFETVFHHDWDYAKLMIGDEEEGCTFLEHGLADEVDDWGARGALLEKYRRLRAVMEARGLKSELPFPMERIRELKRRGPQ